MMSTENLLVTAVDAATICGVSRSAWYKLVSTGKTPRPVKLGRATRWNRDELLTWITAGCPVRSTWETMNCKK